MSLADMDGIRDNLNVDIVVLKATQTLGIELWNIIGITAEEAIAILSEDPRIEYVEANDIKVTSQIIPNDPLFDELWGLNNTGQTGGTPDADIDAPEAWDIQTGNGIVIGVIDTGVDYTHPDLQNNIWTNPGEIPDNGIDDDGNGFIDDYYGYDFVNDDGDPFDDDEIGHGTLVAGIIAAEGNNGIGVTGVNWDAQIVGIKFLDEFGFGSTFDAIQAIEYSILIGADVTNNSWGGGEFSQGLLDAIAAAGEAGQLFVAAAGNSGLDTDIFPEFPAAYDLDNIISVAATNDNDELASFSSFGANSVDIGAPGEDILSTIPGDNYDAFSGTSFAAPHVTGVASLLLSESSDLSADELKERILATVDPTPSLEGKSVSGGRLNSFNALIAPSAGGIEGRKWNDLNQNGFRDGDEPVLENWTIFLDDNENGELDEGEPSRLTDGDGLYSFNFLEAGTYTVAEVVKPGWIPTAPESATQTVTFGEGEILTDIDFGNFLDNPAEISGIKWHDLNQDGRKNRREHVLEDWKIYLDLNQNGQLDEGEPSTLTNEDGEYLFDSLSPESYVVAEVLQPGWQQTVPVVEGKEPVEIILTETNDTIPDAIESELSSENPGTVLSESSIGDNPDIDPASDVDFIEFQLDEDDRVTIDIDSDQFGSGLDSILRLFNSSGNEVASSDDDPAPGEPFTLDSYIDFTANATDIYYVAVSSFDNFFYDPFEPGSGTGSSTGDYELEIVIDDELIPGTYRVELSPGEVVEGLNFGNFELEQGSISGSKWNDLDGDGERDEGEPGLEGWTIYLDQNQNGELDDGELFDVTDENGAYSFLNLPVDTYTVAEVLQDGWQQTFPNTLVFDDPSGDTFGFDSLQLDIASVGAFSDGDSLTFNMDFFTPIFAPSTGAIEAVTGFLDFDLDRDASTGAPSSQSEFAPPDQQGGNLGVEVFIDLFSEEFQPGFVDLVDANTFDLLGTVPISYDEAAFSIQIPLSLLEDDGVLNYGTVIGTFSEATDAAPNDEFGTTGGRLISESDAPLAPPRNDSEWGLSGQSNTAVIESTRKLTNKNQLPNNLSETNSQSLTSSTSGTYTVELEPGQAVTNIDFGNQEIFPGEIRGSKWNDLNGNGERDADEPGLEGWTIFIDDNQNGDLDEGELSTVTDANGDYTFTEIEPGTYTVSEIVQDGWQPTFPVTFEYEFIDSNQPDGPIFDWVDISTVGTELNLFDDDFATVDLPFAFTFFEEDRNTVNVSSNGYLAFESEAFEFFNAPIPDIQLPNNFVAPFWDDLDPSAGGSIYYHSDDAGERFIVQYQDIPRFEDGGALTFEVILESDGSILYQYEEMSGTLDSATVGVENFNGTDGLEIAFNESYVEDGLAVSIEPTPGILDPYSVVVGSGETVTGIDFGNQQTSPPSPSPGLPIFGTPNNDELNIFDGSTIVFAGDGNDIVDASQSSGRNQLFGGDGDDELFASNNDRLLGEAGNDILNAAVGSGNNRLFGGDNNDILFAGVNDRLFGGPGDDLLFAGDGDSLLNGGQGADQFWVANASLPSSPNTITDFELGVDVIGIGGLGLGFDDLALTQQADNTLISALGTDMVILTGIHARALSSSNFVFCLARPNR